MKIGTSEYTWNNLAQILYNKEKLELSESAKSTIQKCRDYLNTYMENHSEPVYGINTGFGALYNTSISEEKLEQLQYNLLVSHACGTGEEVPSEIVRLMLALKVISLSYGHSGIRVETAERLLSLYNNDILPVVYTQGSLGASGDLAPLAHLCLPLIGKGEAIRNGEKINGEKVNSLLSTEPLKLHSKEGLALLNGTQFMLSYGVYLILETFKLLELADVIAALSLEAYDGRIEPFDALLHDIRPHQGQIQVANHFRLLLEGSGLIKRPKAHVQDPYSFRCIPQVHGASRDAVGYCASVILNEVNSVTDNPNIFPDEDKILSGGNFHGQPLALCFDFLAIALAELGSISERRSYLLLSGNRNLPAFLTPEPGLNSGLMIAQYTAASLVSQNKMLCTPASIDSIPSSNGQEDHVSMGANGATKCYKVLQNLQNILSIELLHASQGLFFREPETTSPQLQQFLQDYRNVVPVLENDRTLYEDIKKGKSFIEGIRLGFS